jgi:hypothetical protein
LLQGRDQPGDLLSMKGAVRRTGRLDSLIQGRAAGSGQPIFEADVGAGHTMTTTVV